ncbi:MAG: glycosyltransferase family 2 protein [Nanoarchaeota archaeon]|nr:glycosyltransferase family 2 protein [Nanoarchaeota archaeon]
MWEVPPITVYFVFFIEFLIAFFLLIFYISQKKQSTQKSKDYEITFIIPSYNCEEILQKTVSSIKNTKYPQDKIQIIIVNDGSTDNTLAVAKKLEKQYARIEVINKKNTGKADSLNAGIKQAKTELIAVLDSDTLLKEDMLEKAMPLFSDNITMAVTSRLRPLNNRKIIERMQYVEYTLAGFYRTIMSNANSLPVAPAFTIFRREFFKKHGYFDTNNLTEDLEMGLRIQSNHYNVGYVSHSYASTIVPDTLKKLIKQRVRWAYGTFYNYKKYKHLFFSKKYGDLGIFFLPFGFISILIVSFSLLLQVYIALSWIVKHIQLLILGWLPSVSIDITKILIEITELKIVLLIMSIFIGLITFYLTKWEFKEKMKLKDYAFTILFYLWILAFVYVITLAYFIVNKKPKW